LKTWYCNILENLEEGDRAGVVDRAEAVDKAGAVAQVVEHLFRKKWINVQTHMTYQN
jgi:hypothetical protein